MPNVKGRGRGRSVRGSLVSPKELLAAQRDAEILDMRLKGMTTQAISDELKRRGTPLAPCSVWRALDKRLMQTVRPGADALRELELQRLDKLMAGLWSVAVLGDVQAVMACLKLIEARAKLQGLYPKDDRPSGPTVNVSVGQQPDLSLEDVLPLLQAAGFRVVPVDAEPAMLTEGVDVSDGR